jgi:hypothetical protein
MLGADRPPTGASRRVRLLVGPFGQPFEPGAGGVRPRPAATGAPEVRGFRRSDGRQLLFAWVSPSVGPATVDLELAEPAAGGVSYSLDGTPTPVALHGRVVAGLRIEPGSPRILLIGP